MALVVETGAGISGANSYNSLADAQSFIDARDITATLTEGLLLRAMDHLNALRIRGSKTNADNALPCPRYGLYDIEGNYIDSDTVPTGMVTAQIWLAYYIGQGSDPSAVSTPSIRKEKVDVIEVEYAVSDGSTNSIALLSMPNVRDSLKGLLETNAGHIDRA